MNSERTNHICSGLLLIDKPLMYTSHDVVDVVRKKMGMRRVGHAGSLDPMATGLVVILIGGATRLFDHYVRQEKEYIGIMTLGVQTDTQDLEGKIISQQVVTSIAPEQIRKVFQSFTGVHKQRVPRFSSVKIHGVKSYELARKNIAFEPQVKTIEIKELTLCGLLVPDVHFFARVSKGTYIRALCDDVGQTLQTGAVLSALRRTRSGNHHIENSLTIPQLNAMSTTQARRHLIHS